MSCDELGDPGIWAGLLDDPVLRNTVSRLVATIQDEVTEQAIQDVSTTEQFLLNQVALRKARLEEIEDESIDMEMLILSFNGGVPEAQKLADIASERKVVLAREKENILRSFGADQIPLQIARARATMAEMVCQRKNADFLDEVIAGVVAAPPPVETAMPCLAPMAKSITPTKGRASAAHDVQITGTGFVVGSMPALGGVELVSVEVIDAELIVAVVPPGIPTGARVGLVVTNPDGQMGGLVDAWLAF